MRRRAIGPDIARPPLSTKAEHTTYRSIGRSSESAIFSTVAVVGLFGVVPQDPPAITAASPRAPAHWPAVSVADEASAASVVAADVPPPKMLVMGSGDLLVMTGKSVSCLELWLWHGRRQERWGDRTL